MDLGLPFRNAVSPWRTYEIEFVEALLPPEDEACFADVRRMLRARMAGG
jgi:hypothetical protein